MKTCRKCGEEKPLTSEYFYRKSASKDGFQDRCKICTNEREKLYCEKNREIILEKKKKYYHENKEMFALKNKLHHAENKERLNEVSRLYREANKESIGVTKKKWYEQNEEHCKQKKKDYYIENKERLLKYRYQWSQENKDKDRAHKSNYKAKMKKLEHTLTTKQWELIKIDFNNECAYCGMKEEEHIKEWGEQLHQEHFIALSKGGEYTHNNIIPACKSCNCSKNHTDFFEWYPTYKDYNKQREKRILEYLGYTKNTQQLSIL